MVPSIEEDLLRQLKFRGDDEADAIAHHFQHRPAGDMFRGAIAARYAGTDMIDPHVAAWLDDMPELPDWADRTRLANGSAFFAEWGIELGLGLFLSSLPLAYASQEGVQVLALTARLESDTRRRVLESAQFVLDVTAPGALEPGADGYRTVRLVRLMHAGVRDLVMRDDRVPKTGDQSVWPRWDPEWGVPINQQHLVGAMLSYSSSLLPVLDSFGVDYDAQGAEDYCLLWNVVGWLLGIEPDLLPMDRAAMDAADPVIRKLNFGKTAAGTEMTKALIDLVRSLIGVRLLAGLPVAMMRRFIGDDTADLLGAPKANWTRYLVGAAHDMTKKVSAAALHDRALQRVLSWTSRRVLTGFVEYERHGQRPKFVIPEHLTFRRAARR
jgi:hypothetical protein